MAVIAPHDAFERAANIARPHMRTPEDDPRACAEAAKQRWAARYLTAVVVDGMDRAAAAAHADRLDGEDARAAFAELLRVVTERG